MKNDVITLNLSQFAERLNDLMIDCGNVSAKCLAADVNVSKSAIYRYLNAKRLPALGTAVKLADRFNCSLEYLLALVDEDYPSTRYPCIAYSEIIPRVVDRFGISRYKLVKDTGIPESIIYSWQSGQSEPTIESLLTLAQYLDCSIDALIGREKF